MSDTLILKRARWKSLLALAGSLAFVAGGFWMLAHPGGSSRYSPEYVTLVGWACALFFSLSGLSAAHSLFQPVELVLSPQGFEVRGLWGRPLVKWRAVEGFFVTSVRSTKFVSYTLKPDAEGRGAGGALGQITRKKTLPAYLEERPDAVRDVMETWRLRYGSEG